MKEVEVKILNIDKEVLKTKLNNIGAKYIGTYDLKSIFLQNLNGKICRIRKEGDKTVINMKIGGNIKNKIKESDEYEISINGQFKETILFFEKIGFKKIKALRKKRINYSLSKIKYSIDENFFIPNNLEIESINTFEVNKGAKLLGFTNKDFSGMSENEIYNFYNEKRGIIFQYENTTIPSKENIINSIIKKEKLTLINNNLPINEYKDFKKNKIYYNHKIGDLGEIFTIIFKINYFQNKCYYNSNTKTNYIIKNIPNFYNQNIKYLYEGFVEMYNNYISKKINENEMLDKWNEITLKIYFEE